jgi:hypothetical protein
MKQLDLDKSKKIALIINAEVGKCASNVATAFLEARADLQSCPRYIEGLWMIGGQPNLHAWIETDDVIIDPTFAVLTVSISREEAKYCSLLSYSEDEFLDRLEKVSFTIGSNLELVLNWEDPRVDLALQILDPLPGSPLRNPRNENE